MQEINEKRKYVEDKGFQLTKKEQKGLLDFFVSNFLSNHPKYIVQGSDHTPVNFTDGEFFLFGYNRIVFGSHGPYVEFEEKHLRIDLVVPENQRFRLDPVWNVKYLWFTPEYRYDKIYLQKRTVDYADYVPGRYYVDLYLTDLSQIEK